MDKLKIEKINRFLKDEVMSKAVFDVLMESFLKPRTDKNVHTLAASWLSIERLQEGWKELNKFQNVVDRQRKESKQVGM